MLDVCALGELLIDFTCISVDDSGYPTLIAHPGGAPSNFLAALAKYGAKTALIGKTGTDAFGCMLNKTLRSLGIETKGIVSSDSVFTTLAFVTLDKSGNRKFSFSRKPGADCTLRFDELNLSLIDSCKIFHIGSLSLTDEPARSTTRQAVTYARLKGKLISYDPNLRMPLWKSGHEAREQILWGLEQADIVKISDEEVKFLFGMPASEGVDYIFSNFNVKLLFVTCGSEGCYYKNKKAAGKVSALQNIKVKDTTGAGDIFGGSALWRFLQINKTPQEICDDELRDITQFASAAAGLSTTEAGAISSIAEYSRVIKAMQTNYT